MHECPRAALVGCASQEPKPPGAEIPLLHVVSPFYGNHSVRGSSSSQEGRKDLLWAPFTLAGPCGGLEELVWAQRAGFVLVWPFWAIPAPQTLLSGAFFLKQLRFLLPRQSYHLQILSTFQAGSMGNCSRKHMELPSLPLSFCCLVFSLGFFFF